MAEEYGNKRIGNERSDGAVNEVTDRGVFDFLEKKEEIKPQHQVEEDSQVIHGESGALNGGECVDGEKKKTGFLEKLRRSNSSSSSSSDEEEAGEGEEGKKKKKGLKEKIKDKITGDKNEEQPETGAAGEKCGGGVHSSAGTEDHNNKGFIETVKEKLHGNDEHGKEKPKPYSAPPEHPVAGCHEEEKKGILDKIKEKLPGYHPKGEEEKEKEAHASH